MTPERKRQADSAAYEAREKLTFLRKILFEGVGHAYQCGYVDGAKWADSTPAPSEVGDGLKICVGYMDTSEFSMMINENPNGGFKWEFLDFLDPKKQEGEVTKIFISTTDPSHTRRTQNAEVERLKKVVKNYSEMSLSYMAQIQELRSLLEKFKEMTEHAMTLGYLGEGSTKGWAQECLSEYEKTVGNKR